MKLQFLWLAPLLVSAGCLDDADETALAQTEAALSSGQGTSYQGTSYQGTSYQGTSYQGTSYQGTSYQGATYGGTSISDPETRDQSQSLSGGNATGSGVSGLPGLSSFTATMRVSF